MMNRTFLRNVVQRLSLQLQTAPASRHQLFDSVSIDSSVPCGTYFVRFNPDSAGAYLIYYYDTATVFLPLLGAFPGSAYAIVASGKWDADAPISLPGMVLKFSRGVRSFPDEFTFRVVNVPTAVEAVYRKLTIKRADPDKGVNHVSVLVSGRDYVLTAATANAIADAFIEKNLSFRQSRRRGIVEALEKQLLLAQANLASAESKVRDFRTSNPQVGLSEQTQQAIGNLSNLEGAVQTTSSALGNAQRLKAEYANADSAHRVQIAGAMANMLSTYNVPAGKTLSEELNRLLVQQQVLTEKYGSEHPFVVENSRAIKKATWAIVAAMEEFIGSGQSTISRKQENIQKITTRLRQLPAQEMQLGELERNRRVYADIYSAVLGSYNQAKVADAVETNDFYVMDYADAPLPPPADPTQLIILCVVLALMASFGTVIIRDRFDKSVRSQRQLAHITGSPVLEAIPFFYQTGETRSRIRRSREVPLISVPCTPDFTHEVFDSLLVKIKLRMFESTDFGVAVSSLEAGCGKSLVSANLAAAIAMRGHRTFLVDGDLRKGTLKDIFQLPETGGLSGLLSTERPLTEEECLRSFIETKIPNLFVLPSGLEPQNPGALFSSPRMEEFRRLCGKYASYMVFDTPPLGVVSDAAVVEKLFPHYLFVVRSGKTNVAELVTRINEFDQLSEKILGYVLNGVTDGSVSTYYRHYYNYYGKSSSTSGRKRNALVLTKRKTAIQAAALVLGTAAVIGIGIAGIRAIRHASHKRFHSFTSTPVIDAKPGYSPVAAAVPPAVAPSIEPPVAVPPKRKARPVATQSSVPAAPKRKEVADSAQTAVALEAAPTPQPTPVSEKKNVLDSSALGESDSGLDLLRDIRGRFYRGDLAGLDSIFKGPALEDGEYFLWMARRRCDSGEWQYALSLIEKALTFPTRSLGREVLMKEYHLCKAKCLSAAFNAEPTSTRGAAAMEAWYNVKYQFRGSPQDTRYLYADSELRRINKEVNGE
jgi:tyrosine-protein kinase Etk/Wzc